MATATNKTSKEKYEALRELEKEASNKSVAEKCKVHENTLSTWVKNKQKVFDDFQAKKSKGQKSKRWKS